LVQRALAAQVEGALRVGDRLPLRRGVLLAGDEAAALEIDALAEAGEDHVIELPQPVETAHRGGRLLQYGPCRICGLGGCGGSGQDRESKCEQARHQRHNRLVHHPLPNNRPAGRYTAPVFLGAVSFRNRATTKPSIRLAITNVKTCSIPLDPAIW